MKDSLLNSADKQPNAVSHAISWMVNNRVTPNLLMIIFIVGGLFMTSKIKREVFPAFALDTVSIVVSYPGASPEEIEQGIILAIEEAISGMDGIDEIRSTASEGLATVIAELRDGIDTSKAFQDIQAEVDRITTLPADAEEPVISLDVIQMQVLRLNLYGDVDYSILREAATMVKDQLLLYEPQTSDKERGGFFSKDTPWQGISQVEIDNPRNYEIDVAVSLQTLRRYNLTHEEIATKIKAASVEIPGGKLQTENGEILLRLRSRNDLAKEFAKIPILRSSGSSVRLGDIAQVRESFETATKTQTFNGKQAIQLFVYRVGDETPITVSNDTYRVMESVERHLPHGVKWQITSDFSNIYRDRLSLLLKNAFIGLLLVLLMLGLFLEIRLAFWVTMGIPISFLGCLLFLPSFDISINMISMFAFIIALGIVVDDAIIAGENIYEYRKKGMSNIQAAIAGAKDVAIPITFSIITNITAFMPMLFVPGVQGNIWRVIPTVVIITFAISWFESIFILPSHLGYSSKKKKGFLSQYIRVLQHQTSRFLDTLIKKIYIPSLELATSLRYPFVVLMAAILFVTLSYVKSGRIRFILMPRVESNQAVVTAVFPYGSPESRLKEVQQQLLSALYSVVHEALEKHEGQELLENTSSRFRENVLEIRAELISPDVRPISTGELTKLWRKEAGEIKGLQSLLFESDRGGPGGGAALSIELSHRNIAILDRASAALAVRLAEYPNAKDINQGYLPGKMQYTYKVNETGSNLGLTATDVGRQLRSAFQGVIALRQLRGSNEVTVRVHLPEEERQREAVLGRMQVRTPSGSWVNLETVASVTRAPGYTSISRRDGRRTVTVTANVDPIGETSIIVKNLKKEVLPEFIRRYPGLNWSFQGRQAERRESMGALGFGFLYALGGIFLLLAVPFRSYIQPIIVMIAIPFGIIGAVYGHMLMGYNLSLMSMMGMVALSGVVVNDSLVLVDYANKRKREGKDSLVAIRLAGKRRFRPVLLTTLTTFGGLAPMILETSRQARFMIPMAISLGFGILFATVITLTLVPCLYLIVDDMQRQWYRRENREKYNEK